MFELASTMAPVTAIDEEDKFDDNVSIEFAAPPSSYQYLNPKSDVAFCEAINLRV